MKEVRTEERWELVGKFKGRGDKRRKGRKKSLNFLLNPTQHSGCNLQILNIFLQLFEKSRLSLIKIFYHSLLNYLYDPL